jgi:hypothetical protein
MEIEGKIPTADEINAMAEERAKKPCACCGFTLGMRQVTEKVVERIEFGERQGDQRGKPVIESFHQRCYEYVKSQVEKYIKIERERKAG